MLGDVDISWIDKTSAYIILQKPDQVGPALRSLSNKENFKITTYANQQEQCDSKSQSQLKRKISNNESIVKKRKTESVEV